jgi:hypothetical protein
MPLRRRSFLYLVACGCAPGVGTADRPQADEPARSDAGPEPEPEPTEATAPAADLEARVAKLRQEHAQEGYVVLVEPPFVVVGDESEAEVRGHAESTVRWAMSHLREFFPRDPTRIVEVWLLGDEASYRRVAARVFGDDPDTPYGYYSPQHSALIMNIGSGGGTLVHEMVHPLMEANFPACPSWFNEGLASLYEQCGEHEGEIWGYPNWRLPGLQAAIADGSLPAFSELLATTDNGFYAEDPGTHYGQARYLCQWLQDHAKLRPFFHDFVAAAAEDPSGIDTLRRHVGGDLEAFQARWERYVTGLRWPA